MNRTQSQRPRAISRGIFSKADAFLQTAGSYHLTQALELAMFCALYATLFEANTKTLSSIWATLFCPQYQIYASSTRSSSVQ